MESYHILIVDDEPENHIISEEVFNDESENNYQFSHAYNGMECLEQVRESIPDLILLDVMMPEMGGIEVAQKLRENPEYNDISIIFVSALTKPADQLAGYEVGGDDYVGKPFDFDVLTAKVSLALIKKKKIDDLNQHDKEVNILAEKADYIHIINEFALKSYNITDITELMNEFLETLSRKAKLLGMTYVKQKKQKAPDVFFTWHKEAPSDVERFILKEEYNPRTPFIVTGMRAQVTFPHLSVLIKNMPSESEEIYSHCKDLILQMSEITNKRLRIILSEKELGYILDTSQQLLEKSKQSLNVERTKHSEIFSHLLDEYNTLSESLSLDTSQHEKLKSLLLGAQEQSDVLNLAGEKNDNLLTTLLYQLKSCKTYHS